MKLAWIAALLLAVGAPAAAQPVAGPIQIVSAFYGRRDAARPDDFTARLQSICGQGADHCETFCSPAILGQPDRRDLLGWDGRPVCRVTYRCGAATLSSETDRDDTILLTCHAGP